MSILEPINPSEWTPTITPTAVPDFDTEDDE